MSNSKGQLFYRNPQSFYNALGSTGTRMREESKWIGRKKRWGGVGLEGGGGVGLEGGGVGLEGGGVGLEGGGVRQYRRVLKKPIMTVQ